MNIETREGGKSDIYILELVLFSTLVKITTPIFRRLPPPLPTPKAPVLLWMKATHGIKARPSQGRLQRSRCNVPL